MKSSVPPGLVLLKTLVTMCELHEEQLSESAGDELHQIFWNVFLDMATNFHSVARIQLSLTVRGIWERQLEHVLI